MSPGMHLFAGHSRATQRAASENAVDRLVANKRFDDVSVDKKTKATLAAG